MQINFILKYFIIFCFIQCLFSCNQSSKKTEKIKPTQEEYKKNENIDFRFEVDYLLNNSSDDVKKKNWFKFQTSVGNDEYDEWLEGEFHYSKNEWVRIIYGDINGKYPNYLETNSNSLMKNSTLLIGDFLKDAVYENSVSVDYEDGSLILKEKNNEYHLSCSENVDVADFEKIIESKETNNKSIFPKSLESCKLIFLRIFKPSSAKSE